MTDPIAPEPAAPTPPPYSAAPAAAPGVAPKQGLSLTSFILGLAGLVLSFIPVIGFLSSVGAVVLGFMARAKEKSAPRWMWIVGLITGFLALAIGLIVIVGFIAAIALAGTSASYN